MQFSLNTYIQGNSVIHRIDARVKLVLLLAFSISLFFIQTWLGLLTYTVLCVAAILSSKIPLTRLLSLLIPLYIILAFTIFFNGFSFDISREANLYGFGQVSTGFMIDWNPVALVGSFGFVPEGFMRGCFYALRIILLVLVSFVVSFSTPATELIDALNDFLKPLRIFKIPTEDIAMIISIALRFIPLTVEELLRVKAAQESRGAVFAQGSPVKRIAAWQPVMIPLFVGLFRRADNLALAMEARCFGMSPNRTRLHPRNFTVASGLILMCGLALCALLALVF